MHRRQLVATPDNELRELVRRYRVTWEMRPEMGPSARSVAPIGYVVELNAVPDDPAEAATIAASKSGAVEDALAKIAGAIAGDEVVHVGRGTWQLGTAHDAQAEVTATVTVLHHDGKSDNRPQDPAEQERAAALVERLRALGAQEHHWRDDDANKASS
jgi:hypothetical protein